MIIKIDSREKDLQNKLSYYISCIPVFRNLKVLSEKLPLGDIIISNNDKDVLIIERKSINDLLSSIKDGRYEEQSYRLNGLSQHNHNIIYLIEGDVNKANMFRESQFEKLTLYSAIFSLNYYKGFSVIRTFNLDETALFICNTTIKLIKGEQTNRKAYYSHPKNMNAQTLTCTNTNTIKQENCEETHINIEKIHENSEKPDENKEEIKALVSGEENASDKDYIEVIKKVKKENITPENIDEIMLCQIPGVSTTTSISIIKKYSNLINLIRCIQEDENCLNDISYTNNKGQSRKISKPAIANIKKFLFKN